MRGLVIVTVIVLGTSNNNSNNICNGEVTVAVRVEGGILYGLRQYVCMYVCVGLHFLCVENNKAIATEDMHVCYLYLYLATSNCLLHAPCAVLSCCLLC